MKNRSILFVSALLVLVAGCQTLGRGGLDKKNMALSGDPGVDFYRYANGGWLDSNPVPPEYSSWGVFHELQERNQKLLRTILESYSSKSNPAGSNEQKLGDMYATGMDTDAIEAAGLTPLSAQFDMIHSMSSKDDLPGVLAQLHSVGVGAFFGASSEADVEDSTMVILYAGEGGLGLPDRDYYFRDRDAETREQYVAHVARMMELTGHNHVAAAEAAQSIMRLETHLADASFTAVEARNPQNFARKVNVADVDSELDNFDWSAYLSAIGMGSVTRHGMPNEKYWPAFDSAISEFSLDEIKLYLEWQLVSAMAPYLTAAFEEESFDFNSRKLSGTDEMQPRWKRVLETTSGGLGEALGEAFVARAFSPKAKAKAEEMVKNLFWAMGEHIKGLAWMSDETKEQALIKLNGFGYKIGYPDEWQDYSSLQIDRDSYAGNVMRSTQFAIQDNLSKVGKPVDPTEWGMTPQMVNAYYHPLRNEIVFPAAILQPPFFSEKADDAVNYGAMGGVIGHEITHGFDDSGSQFDAEGNLRNWWTDSDREEFMMRANRLSAQYSAYEVLPGVHVNGDLTLGENIADLGGLKVSYTALQKALEGQSRAKIGGFTPEQRFFLSWTTAWRQNARDEYLQLLVSTNPHSPARFRGIGPVGNLQEFADAFGLDESAPMVRSKSDRVEIW